MPTLAQIAGSSSSPTTLQIIDNLPVIEPLDGPSTVDQVMDYFPEELYQQGRDSHLYRFLTALAGDSGAGLVKAQLYAARLKFEAEFLSFQILDQFYAAQFRFNRLKTETYPSYNPDTDALTPTIWDALQLADQQYRQRVMEFFTALRFGNSPEGLATMAKAASGIDCEIVENYKWIFDQYSDDPLGIPGIGTTASTAEFIVVPRFINGDIQSEVSFNETYPRTYTHTGATLGGSTRPATISAEPSVAIGFGTTPVTHLDPDLERNVIELLDRVRPTGTVASVIPDEVLFAEIAITAAHASSERIQANRLVTGKANVPWPNIDPTQNYFIEPGVENEAGYFYGSARELPVIFQTIETVHAYTEQALADPEYLTSEFYDNSSGISVYDTYLSEYAGTFSPLLAAIFPFLATVTGVGVFEPSNAVAPVDTPLVMQGRAIGQTS